MRTIHVWAGLRLACVALACSVVSFSTTAFGDDMDSVVDLTVDLPTPTDVDPAAQSLLATAQAIGAPLFRFNTIGDLDLSVGVDGENVIGFRGISGEDFIAPSNFSLGEIQVLSGSTSGMTTYDNVPVTFTIDVSLVNGEVPVINETPVKLEGVLNGTVNGSNQSNATLTWNTENLPSFRVGDFVATITGLDPVDIAPFSTNGGRTSIQGRIEAFQIPEPASIAVFLVALVGGIGLRRRALARPIV